MCLVGQADMSSCYIDAPIDGNHSGVCIGGECKSTSSGVPLDLSYSDGCGPANGAYCGGVATDGSGYCTMNNSDCGSSHTISGGATGTPTGITPGVPSGITSGTPSGNTTPPMNGVEMPNAGDIGLSDSPIEDILVNLLEWLLEIVGVIALIGFVISGVQYITASGNESMMETAKKNLTYSIIGVIVVLGSFVIIQAIHVALQGYGGAM